MYCSSCGTAVAQGLTYCSYCGAKVGGAKNESTGKPAELFPESLIWAIASVFIVGLGCIIGLMAVMKQVLDFKDGMVITIILLSFLLLFMVEGTFIWLLLSRRRGIKEAGDGERLQERATKELDEAQARALPEPLPSITEHTTRTLEPLYSERKAE